MGGLIVVFLLTLTSLLLLPFYPIPCSISLFILAILTLIPLEIKPPNIIKRFFIFSIDSAFDYFPTTLVFEDKDALKRTDRAYVLGYEPHGILPQGIVAFTRYARNRLPPGLKNTRVLVSSAGFFVAIMRHLWWWFGCRPVSRAVFSTLLSRGVSVTLCPGGVKEVLYMGKGKEVVYLRRRHGFVKLAIQHGAPLVPVFAFGQSDMYTYIRPFLDWPKGMVSKNLYSTVTKQLAYVPLIAWGRLGLPIPRATPLMIVVGKPIEVQKIEHPSNEVVQEYLDKFIEEMSRVFYKHRKAAGYSKMKLEIH